MKLLLFYLTDDRRHYTFPHFIKMINAEHIIPAHGNHEKTRPMLELCNELGYKTGKNVHLMADGESIKI